jgi:hypothetical protein
MVCFPKVDNYVYKLPDRNLQNSVFFSGMFGTPLRNVQTREIMLSSEQGLLGINGGGESDENPIILKGIAKEAFDALLLVFPT